MPTLDALLTADPYRTLENSQTYIPPKDFYNDADGVYVVANDCSKIEEILKENDQMALIFRLNGYAGCGKTMFAHFVIWKYGRDDDFYYEFDENEGGDYSLDYVITRITRRLSSKLSLLIKNDYRVIKKFDILGKQFDCTEPINYGLQDFFLPGNAGYKAWENAKHLFSEERPRIANQIRQAILKSINQVKQNAKPPQGSRIDNESYELISALSFLLILDFLLRHALTLSDKEAQTPSFCLLDNLDNLKRDVIAELYFSILDVIEKIQNFYRNNSKEESSFTNNFRIIYIVSTRAVTYMKLRDEVLSKWHIAIWEKIDRAFYTNLSLNSELHGKIIEKRRKYWEKNGKFHDIQKKQFEEIEDLIKTQFSSGSFSALFNDNYFYCVKLILEFYKKCNNWGNISKDFLSKLRNECFEYSISESIPESKNYLKTSVGDAKKGIFLRIMLEILKENGAYASPYDQNRKDYFRTISKLGLAPLDSISRNQPFGVSLSRLILTFLRSKESHPTSLKELFDCFSAYDPEDICRSVYALSENIRDVWRRLIMFNRTIPIEIEDLYKQARAYKQKTKIESGEKGIDYTEIELCQAGEEYLTVVVPSFEFFLSRLDQQRNNLENYPPLFLSTSIRNDKWNSSIKAVLEAVEKCARLLEDYDKNMITTLINNEKEDFIQHLFVASRKDKSIKQTHLSRIVFSHITYLDHFRVYYLWYWRKNDPNEKIKSQEQLKKDNERIVSYIIRYLTIFDKSWMQNEKYTALLNNRFLGDMYELTRNYSDCLSINVFLEDKKFSSLAGIKMGFENQKKAQQMLLDQILIIHRNSYAQDTFEIPIAKPFE